MIIIFCIERVLTKGSRKKVSPLKARILIGGGKGRKVKEKRTFFEDKKRVPMAKDSRGWGGVRP